MNDDATEDSWKRISNNAGDNSTIFKKFMQNQIYFERDFEITPKILLHKTES